MERKGCSIAPCMRSFTYAIHVAKRHHRRKKMSRRRALGHGRSLAVTATKFLRRGASSSFQVTHLHTRASEKKHSPTHKHGTFVHARARTSSRAYTHARAPVKYERPPRDPAQAVFYPSSQFPPRVAPRSFEGDERAGVSERKGKGICRVRRDGEEEERKRG